MAYDGAVTPTVVSSSLSTSRWADELALAAELAIRAGGLQLERLGRLERVDLKGPRDVVTEADHLSEELIIRGIRERYPADGFLAEESGETAGSGALGPGVGRTWIVDPLDGTINYANAIPFFCVSIGLAIDGRPVAGIVHDPVRGETFSASADGPALLDERPIQVAHKERFEDLVATIAIGGPVRRRRKVVRLLRASRSMGSAALTLAYVANGRFDAYAQGQGISAWDVAAAGLVAERAGARVTTLDGEPWFDLGRPDKSWSLLAAAPEHHAAILELLR